MRIVTGVFDDADAAMRAGEKLRESVARRATIRLFVSGPSGLVVETLICEDVSSWLRVTLFGLVLGVIGAMTVGALGGGWGLGLVGLVVGAVTGAMLGVWLIGAQFPRHILGDRDRGRHQVYQRELAHGRAVVTVVVGTHVAAGQVVEVMELEGGRVSEGFLHERAAGSPPLPIT